MSVLGARLLRYDVSSVLVYRFLQAMTTLTVTAASVAQAGCAAALSGLSGWLATEGANVSCFGDAGSSSGASSAAQSRSGDSLLSTVSLRMLSASNMVPVSPLLHNALLLLALPSASSEHCISGRD